MAKSAANGTNIVIIGSTFRIVSGRERGIAGAFQAGLYGSRSHRLRSLEASARLPGTAPVAGSKFSPWPLFTGRLSATTGPHAAQSAPESGRYRPTIRGPAAGFTQEGVRIPSL